MLCVLAMCSITGYLKYYNNSTELIDFKSIASILIILCIIHQFLFLTPHINHWTFLILIAICEHDQLYFIDCLILMVCGRGQIMISEERQNKQFALVSPRRCYSTCIGNL